MAAVERDAEGEGVEGDKGVAGGLVHVAFIGVVGGGGTMGGGGGRRGGVEVCKGDYVVFLGQTVEEGEEGVFAARYESYHFVARRGQHRL